MHSAFERNASSTNVTYGALNGMEQQAVPNLNNFCLSGQQHSFASCLLGSDYPGSPYFTRCAQLYQDSFNLSNSILCPNRLTNQAVATSGLETSDYPCKYTSKTTEIWRPFSPPPSNELWTTSEPIESWNPSESNELWTFEKYSGRQENQRISGPCLISPSAVKIEPSKTSLFKPFKRKNYTCSHCSLTYSNNAQLISHMRVHTGVKPYTCEYSNCSKSFARMEELTRHSRIHSGYKPHRCSACGKSFGRKDHLSKHQKTHLQVSEKRVYVCCVPGCGHRYTRSDALTRHKSSAHTNKHKEKDSTANGMELTT